MGIVLGSRIKITGKFKFKGFRFILVLIVTKYLHLLVQSFEIPVPSNAMVKKD